MARCMRRTVLRAHDQRMHLIVPKTTVKPRNSEIRHGRLLICRSSSGADQLFLRAALS